MQLLKKISRATVYGDKEKVLDLVMKDKNIRHQIYTVYGICNGQRNIDPEENDKTKGKGLKPGTALIGDFRAVNTDGEIFASGVCYVPQYLADLILGKLSEEIQTIKFGFDMMVRYNAESATFYEYDAAMIGSPVESDAMKEMEHLVASHIGQKKIAHAKAGDSDKVEKKK